MNATEEKEPKGKLRNFKFVMSADNRLTYLSERTGKDMTVILEDLILGRRQFSPDIEDFIQSECQRTRRPRDQVIEACLYAVMRDSQSTSPHTANERPTIYKAESETPAKSLDEIAKEAARRAIGAGSNKAVSSGTDKAEKRIVEAVHRTTHPPRHSKRK